MTPATIATLVLALLAVAFLAWLLFGPPDEDALDRQHESARPYDSPSASRKHPHRDLARLS